MIINQIKRSNNGKKCDAFKNILENKGKLFYIPTGSACFRKCLEFIYKKDFSNENKEFILSFDRCKNIMTSAKTQPFRRKYNIELGVYKRNNDLSYLKLSLKEEFVHLFTTILFALYGKVINQVSLVL